MCDVPLWQLDATRLRTMPQQQATLEQRGYLSPDEIHQLAAQTKGAVGRGGDKADCHSDYVDPDAAKRHQAEKLVQVGRKPGTSATPSA